MKYKRKISKKLEFYKKVSSISALYAGASKQKFDETVNQSLKIIGDFVKADRVYIFNYDFEAGVCNNTYEYCSTGISAEIDNLQGIEVSLIPEWVDAHRNNVPLYITDVSKMAPDDNVRVILDPQGVKSLIVIPLIDEEDLYGFIGFDSVKKKRVYTSFEQGVLAEYAEILISTLKRHDLEDKLEKEKNKTDFILEATNIGSWEWNLETNKIKINDVWATMLGYRKEDFKDADINVWKNLINKDDFKKSEKKYNSITGKNEDFYEIEYRLRHKNGHDIWIQNLGRVIEWRNEKPFIMTGVHIDITDSKKKEIELRSIHKAVEASPVIIGITNPEGVVQYVNPDFIRTTGYAAKEILGKKFNILKSGIHDDNFYKKIYETINKGDTWKGEFCNKKKNGTLYWEKEIISPVMDDNQKIVSIVAIKTDITTEKEANEKLDKRRIELEQFVDEKIKEIVDSQKASIIAFAKLTESRDFDTGQHVERVQHLSKALAIKLKDNPKYQSVITPNFIDDIFFSSSLHDLGKIKILDKILLKPGKLTIEEFDEIKKHVTYGSEILFEMVRNYPQSSMFIMGAKIAKYHHEKYDGSGYNEGLSGDEIPLEARIVALVDVYDALRSRRSYKEVFNHKKTVEIISESKGTHFDPDVFDAFLEINEQFEIIYDSLA